jgi:hypothetical protein
MNVYNNRLYTWLEKRSYEHFEKKNDEMGVSPSNKQKYDEFVTRDAHFSFWSWILLIILIVWFLVDTIIKFMPAW